MGYKEPPFTPAGQGRLGAGKRAHIDLAPPGGSEHRLPDKAGRTGDGDEIASRCVHSITS